MEYRLISSGEIFSAYLNPNLKFILNNTLIFFDEVQEYMDATTSLKFFALDKRF